MRSQCWACQPQPGPGEIEVWLTDLDDPRWSAMHAAAVLSADERARGERRQRPEDRARFVAAHVFLRVMLAPLLGCEPAAVRLESSPNGKPRVPAGCPQCRSDAPRFNLSHSHDKAVVAIASADSEVGADIEVVRDFPELTHVAADNFTPDELRWLHEGGDSDRLLRFYTLWTRKEACLKAIGAGLRRPLSGVSVTRSSQQGSGHVQVLSESGQPVRIEFRDVPAPVGYAIAVASTRPIASVILHRTEAAR